MPIFRAPHDRENPYFVVNRTGLNDSRLTTSAKGVLLYLLSKPDGWEIKIEDILNYCSDKITSVQNSLRLLRKLGYVVKKPKRVGNRVRGATYEIYENPVEVPAEPAICQVCQQAKKPAQTLESRKPIVQTKSSHSVESGVSGVQETYSPDILQSREAGPIVSNERSMSIDQEVSIEKKRTVTSALADSSLVPEETGFNFAEKREPEKKSQSRIFAERLYNSLSVKRKIFRPVDIKSWTKEMAKFIAESDVSVEEFEKVVDWYCRHIGEDYVPQAYSAKSFVDKFPQICQQSQVFVVNRILSPIEQLKEKYRNEILLAGRKVEETRDS